MKNAPRLPTTTPRCFHNSAEFASWATSAAFTGGCYEAGFCTDCTPQYQAKMLAARRCDHPEIQFGLDQDGFIQGTVKLIPKQE